MSYNKRNSNYKCISVEIIGRNNVGSEGLCYFAKVKLINENPQERQNERSLEITLNGHGVNKATRKIRRELLEREIKVPENLKKLIKPYEEKSTN